MPQITQASVDREYKRNAGNLRREDVQALQEWQGKQPHLPQITELEIILFLHSCYYSVEAAKVTIDTYYTVRTHCPEFFINRDPKDKNVRQAMDIVVYAPLPEPTPEGYKVIACKLMIGDPNLYVFADVLKVFSMIVDIWLRDEGTAQGHCIVFDMDCVTFGHLTKLGVMPMKKFLYYLQEALPFRLKGLHFLNTVSFMDKILALMKPFMKKELMDVLHLHQKADDNFFKFIPQRCLPSDLGGTAESYKILQDKMNTNISDNYQWFVDDEQKGRVNETRRPGKAKNAGDLFGVEGTFKKLDID